VGDTCTKGQTIVTNQMKSVYTTTFRGVQVAIKKAIIHGIQDMASIKREIELHQYEQLFCTLTIF
jgi:hypothetical protein